jgi:hypothetical protein
MYMDAAVETYRRLGFAEHKLSYAPNIAFALRVTPTNPLADDPDEGGGSAKL